jgi:hypothetical protein
MRHLNARLLLVAAVVFAAPPALAAQARPTPEQAEVLLQTRPDLVAQLRQRIATSGLTPDQVRARLRAEGYPENLLDSYISGGDTMGAPEDAPNAQTLDAVRALGIADSADVLFTARPESTIDCSTVPPLPRSGSDSLAGPGQATRGPQATALQELCRLRDSLSLEGVANVDELGRTRRLPDGPFPADSGFRLFGLDVFRGRTTQFDPNAPGPVDASYRLGAGDKLVLILTGDVEQAYQLDVTREGFVVIPQVGQVYVANLTLGQLEDLLFRRLGSVYSGVSRGAGATTRFSISVARAPRLTHE